MRVSDFVAWIYPQVKNMDEIDPLFVTAQAALESGWGKSAIGNNLFGITKGTTWVGPVKLVTTTEYFSSPNVTFTSPEEVLDVTQIGDKKYKYKVKRFFRHYDSVGDCLRDHLRILKKKGYADAWPYRKDAKEYVRRIVDSVGSKYATDPNYVETMLKVIEMVKSEVIKQHL
jgi:flagellar protein FlgJ